tara:strand:+ start:2688 stop:3413 length:726 start_codon:yes stop_codon:yes gene_type:complete
MEIVDISPENFVYDYDIINNDEDQFDYYKKYYDLHTEFLRPLNIKIDINLFEKEIKQYHNKFRRWGSNRNHLPRYGISLVNYDGNINGKYDIACGPLDQYNLAIREKRIDVYPHKELKEKDFREKTEVFYNLQSMRPLDCIKNFLLRSTINLKHKHGNFVPHIDTAPKPEYNLRLWGVNKPDQYVFDYIGNKCIDVEPGRLYLIDTTQFHYARSLDDMIYTFFIALDNSDETFDMVKLNLL